jgi:hypothetical protein
MKSNDGKGWSPGVVQQLTGQSIESLRGQYPGSI